MKKVAIRDNKGRFIKGANLGHLPYGGFNTRFKKGHSMIKGSEKGWFSKDKTSWDKHPRFKTGIWAYQQFVKDQCEYCGLTKNLMIHHLDHNRNNNIKENFRTVCAKCHTTIEHPRKFGGNQYVRL